MKLLNQKLDSLVAEQKKTKSPHPALMTHVVLGYPSLKESMNLVRAMVDGGASFIELQIPFSDPMADGPTIMRANENALTSGTSPRDCMQAMETLSRELPVPLLFMSYYNLLFRYKAPREKSGLRNFLKDARSAGAEGLIVPDIPPEEKEDGYWKLAEEYELCAVPLVSPVSSTQRMKKIAAQSKQGFVYCVSTTGTTGSRKQLAPDLSRYLKEVGKHFSIPRAVGFGISSPSHVRALAGKAEIAVVGSAMINLVDQTAKRERLKVVRSFTSELSDPNR